MSIYETIILTIVASSLSSGIIEVTGYNFTVDKLLGVWYTVGLLPSNHLDIDITCDWTDITKLHNNYWHFIEVGRAFVNGVPRKTVGHGRIVNSTIHSLYFHNDGEVVSTVMLFNNGSEMILHNELNDNRVLMSRRTSTSTEAKGALEQHGAHAHTHPIYINHHNCTYIYD